MQRLSEITRRAYVYYPFHHPDDYVYPPPHKLVKIDKRFEDEPLSAFINLEIVFMFLRVPEIPEDVIYEYFNARVWTVGEFSYAIYSGVTPGFTGLHITFIHKSRGNYTPEYKEIAGMFIHERADVAQVISVPFEHERYLVGTPETISKLVAYAKTPETVGIGVQAITGKQDEKLATLLLEFLMNRGSDNYSRDRVIVDRLGPTSVTLTHDLRRDRVFYDSRGYPHRAVRRLGSGVYGTTYELDGGMCVKLCDVDHGQTEYENARILNKLKHPGREFIVRYLDMYKKSYCYVFFMELYDETLVQYTQRVSESPYLAKWASQCLSLLEALQSVGLEHGDIHANNIMLKNGDIRLIDFGMAGGLTTNNTDKHILMSLLYHIFPNSPTSLEKMAELQGTRKINSTLFADWNFL